MQGLLIRSSGPYSAQINRVIRGVDNSGDVNVIRA
jgi:hypothetical protein